MRLVPGRLVGLAAWAIVACVLLAPLLLVGFTSLRVEQVVTKDGRVHTAAGEVREERGALAFAVQSAPGEERVPLRVPLDEVAERRSAFGLDHYRFVLGDARTHALLRDSLLLGLGAVVVALLLGLPAAWALARRRVPARGLIALLLVTPLLLPPFVLGMGAARPYSEALAGLTGLAGTPLQLATAMAVLGAVLAPVVVLLVGRAWAQLPAGPVEAALLLGGPRAAFRAAVLPRLLPAVFCSALLVLVLALADFAVADLMTFLLPGGGVPLAVFSKEVQLQWKQEQNTGRAVATGAPLLLLCALALLLAWWLFRRARAAQPARGGRVLEPRPLTLAGGPFVVLALAAPLLLGLVLPLMGLCSWAGRGGETVASGSSLGSPVPAAQQPGRLFDLAGALERTPGSAEDRDRWLKAGLLGTLLALAAAVPIARAALRGGALVRGAALAAGGLALAAPGLVIGVGTLLTWTGVEAVEVGPWRTAFALAARVLPLALLGAALALREVGRGQEEAARLLGAGGFARWTRITLPQAALGLLATAVLTLVLALREVDAVVLIETRLFPLRLYDKIHYSRLADEANLALLALLWLFVPAALLAGLWAMLRRRRNP
jgi:iron(III) transport system permease protein